MSRCLKQLQLRHTNRPGYAIRPLASGYRLLAPCDLRPEQLGQRLDDRSILADVKRGNLSSLVEVRGRHPVDHHGGRVAVGADCRHGLLRRRDIGELEHLHIRATHLEYCTAHLDERLLHLASWLYINPASL